jgi:hypothetical protein
MEFKALFGLLNGFKIRRELQKLEKINLLTLSILIKLSQTKISFFHLISKVSEESISRRLSLWVMLFMFMQREVISGVVNIIGLHRKTSKKHLKLLCFRIRN